MLKKTYRTAIIGRTGKGDYGHGLDTVWRELPQAEVVAVADENPQGAAAAKERTGARSVYTSYVEMLQRERPEIVAVAPRWVDQHRDMLLACAEQGCHVYMEKPFCRTLEEADEVVRAFEMRHLKLAIAHTTRYSPALAAAEKLLRDGEIGDVLEARARGKEDARGGGEDFWVLGSHLVDLLRALFGDPQSCCASVTIDGRPVVKTDVHPGKEGIGPLAGDAVEARYAFPHNLSATVASRRNKAGQPSRFGVQIFGSKGILELQTGYLTSGQILKDASWSPQRSGATWRAFTPTGLSVPPGTQTGMSALHNAGNVAAILDLIEAIERDRQPVSGLYDARWSIEMIAAAFESHRLRRSVSLPLRNRQNPLSMLETSSQGVEP